MEIHFRFFLPKKRTDNSKECRANQRRTCFFISIKNQKYPTDSENEANGEGHPEGGHALAMLVFFQLDGSLMRKPLCLMRSGLIFLGHSENSVSGSGQKLLQALHDGGRWYGTLIEYFLCVPDSRLLRLLLRAIFHQEAPRRLHVPKPRQSVA